MSLPLDFAWFPDSHCEGKWCLRIGGLYGTEVVRVSECVDGSGWSTITNRHREWGDRGHSHLTSKALALRMANRWAVFHAERLLAEVGAHLTAKNRPTTGSLK